MLDPRCLCLTARAIRARLRLATIFGLLFFCSTPAHAQDTSIEDAIRGALRTHERSKVADLQIEAAEGDVESARAGFLPSLTLNASATAAPDVDERYITGVGSLTLRQPLLAPSAIPRLSSAEHSLEAQKLSSEEEKRSLAFDTARAFLDALAAERLLDAAKAQLERAQANLDNAEARVAAELNSSNDVTRAKLEVAGASREVTLRKRNASIARLALGTLTGVEVKGNLVSPEKMFAKAKAFSGNATTLSQAATNERADIKALAEQSRAARDAASEPNYRLIPSIDLTGQVRILPAPLPEQPWHDESVTLSLTWTIFDGGARYGDRKSLLARAKAAELEESLQKRNLSAEVRSALTQLDASRETYKLAEEASASAQNNTEETRVLYQQGLARAIELVDANAEQFDAEVDLASSRIEMARSYLELRFALAMPPVDGAEGKQ